MSITQVNSDSSLYFNNEHHTFTVEVEYVGTRADRGEQWQYTITADGKVVHVQADIFSPFHELDEGKVMYSLTGFMLACIESINYGGGENANLFDPRVADWLVYWSNEIAEVNLDLMAKYEPTVTFEAEGGA